MKINVGHGRQQASEETCGAPAAAVAAARDIKDELLLRTPHAALDYLNVAFRVGTIVRTHNIGCATLQRISRTDYQGSIQSITSIMQLQNELSLQLHSS